MNPFVVPQPAPMEHHDQWLRRIAAAFEEWANQPQLYSGATGQTRFQRDFAEAREWAIAAAREAKEAERAIEREEREAG